MTRLNRGFHLRMIESVNLVHQMDAMCRPRTKAFDMLLLLLFDFLCVHLHRQHLGFLRGRP
jgi:hypothetical protein